MSDAGRIKRCPIATRCLMSVRARLNGARELAFPTGEITDATARLHRGPREHGGKGTATMWST